MKILIALIVCGLMNVARAEECTVNPNAINLALYGRAYQSSIFPIVPRPGPERAHDQISNTNSSMFTCVITKLEFGSFWKIDLQESYIIDLIIIVLREDECWNCMEGVQILVGDDPNSNNPLCATITGVKKSQPVMKFYCKGMQGRFVTFIHKQHSGIVAFCEARIYNQIPLTQ